MDSAERLTPLPHFLKSIRSRNWSLSGASMEWVDNSLQHGMAKNITLVIENGHSIGLVDDGVGIDDINRVFTLGDASAYGDLSQIGQYGVGATDAMIFLGEKAKVETVRNGRKHKMAVDWTEVEASGLWPLRYSDTGTPEKKEVGTKIIVQKLFSSYHLKTSEALGKDFGLTFAPALRAGTNITVYHRLVNGTQQRIEVQPFTPADLTDAIDIEGSIDTLRDPLHWTGRAGLSASLVERHNGVHIAFRHRVIEMTRDPFMGVSAPTLYVEVQLDEKTPWKYQLSDHKDKVVRHRDALMESINEAIKPLLAKAKDQATNLALLELTAKIQEPINKAIKGAGLLHYDPEEEPVAGGIRLGDDVADKTQLHAPKDVGDPGKEITRPTGIKIEYVSKATLEGRAFAWDIAEKLMTIKLEKEMFSEILGWPPKMRDKHVVHLVVSFLSHAVDLLYCDEGEKLRRAVSKGLYEQIENWATQPEKVAPYLYNRIINGVVLHS